MSVVRSTQMLKESTRQRRRSADRCSLVSDVHASSSDGSEDMLCHETSTESALAYERLQPRIFGSTVDVLPHYVQLEIALSNRRKIMYTDVKMKDFYTDTCQVPYDVSQLRQFDYRHSHGFVRHDFIMLYDFCNGFMNFDRLSRAEKLAVMLTSYTSDASCKDIPDNLMKSTVSTDTIVNIFFRYACAVDCLITSAYYTYHLGRAHNRMVMFNAEYVPMEPMPIKGNEPGAEALFETKADHEKYKSLMPTKIRQWTNMCLPFCELHASFEEYALLKALTIWHFMFYRLTTEGRVVCQQQRDFIIQALHRRCIEQGADPAVRLGSVLLAMSYVLEQVQDLLYNYRMLTFFDVLKCDPVLVEIIRVAVAQVEKLRSLL
ncbi:Ligand-binding domain of nuclear hormone receptor [Ancylostoma ceylanicum]|uniref:Ligand-binding domain of nuclear hormone receptor n=1 Tax=Ancylostoma ceylanicum TaxID=53326 RepID=A0A0D6LA75_9BILA|nr:Ligand-binding domain of nuclear hormone receptor [Ancylostoma ceylanicum]